MGLVHFVIVGTSDDIVFRYQGPKNNTFAEAVRPRCFVGVHDLVMLEIDYEYWDIHDIE